MCDLKVRGLSIEGARSKQTFDRFNYRIFAFSTPMQPGEKRALTFTTRLTEKERAEGVKQLGNILLGRPSRAADYAPNEWDRSYAFYSQHHHTGEK